MSMWWLLLAIPALLMWQNLRRPELGVNEGRLKPLGAKPNAVSTQAADAKKRVAPIPCGDLSAPIDQAVKVLSEMPGAEVRRQGGQYACAVFKTPLLRFRDDVEVFFEPETRHMHFRSASRAGYSDMGVNRKRYKHFANAFQS